MKVIHCKTYEEMSARAAELLAAAVADKDAPVLGLATGSTPIGLYNELVRMSEEGKLDFRKFTTYNLDEYYPIRPENEQSYRYFMNEHLFDRIPIDKARTFVPDGTAPDGDAEAARYEALVRSIGGADVQVLGIGRNGHIAFNEPDEALCPVTHVTNLTENTIQANARFFASEDEVPHRALSMGMGTILAAKKILILASGADKREAVRQMLLGTVSTSCPASFLHLHGDVTLLCDAAADPTVG